MSKNKQIPLWAKCGHKKPVTRREILSFSSKAFMASLAVPNLAQAITAANCPRAGFAPGMIPFFSIHLSGGAAMSANFLPMAKSGEPIKDRSRMGLGKGDIKIEKAFGAANFVGNGNSKMLTGMRAQMGAAESKTAFVGICVGSFDDSDKNKFNPNGLLLRTGYRGEYLPQINRLAGASMRTQPAMVVPATPLMVSRISDMSQVLNLSASLKSLKVEEKHKLGRFISRLNQAQLSKLGRVPASSSIKNAFECAGLKNETLLKDGGADVNPFSNSHKSRFETIWSRDATQQVFGSMAYNTLMNHSGPGHIALGGYDYHDGTRTRGDAKDREAGELIGRIIATADYLKKPVFIMVTTDGSTGSPSSTDQQAPWVTDFGRASAVYMLSYDPNKRPSTSTNQLGHLLESQAVDDSHVLGISPEKATLGVFANYCSLIGKMELLEQLPRRPFEPHEYKDVIAFHKG